MYITLTEIKNYLNIDLLETKYDTLLTNYINKVSYLINNYLNIDTLLGNIKVEKYKYNGSGIYYLDNINITEIIKINNIEINSLEYELTGRKLQLFNFNNRLNDKINKIKIEYKAGFNEIPYLIKQSIFESIEAIFNDYKNGQIEGTNLSNVKNFKQGNLSVSFGDNSSGNVNIINNQVNSILQLYLSKYKRIKIASN